MKPKLSSDSMELRLRAEARLSAQRKRTLSAGEGQKSKADTLRDLHELEVHQVELEMQNEELEEARNKLEALLEKYTDLYDFAPVGYLTLDRDGSIREANLAAASLLGVERSALVGRRFGLFVAAANRPAFGDFFETALASQVRESCELTLDVEGGPPLDVEVEALVFESGHACRMTLTDITALRRAEADRLILNKLESTGILAGGIAHDFNNLLTVVLLNLEMAQNLVPPGQEVTRHLKDAKQAALLTKGLTAQLLTFAEGGAPIRTVMLLSGLIQESVRLALRGSNVRSEFFLAEDLWSTEVDAGQLGQVIRNMILNAREAMPRGGVVSLVAENVVLGDREPGSLPGGEYVRVSITDVGAGIAKDVLPKIFDPYFSTKQRGPQKGMGLGLTICHSVVQKHGGAITVESVAGAGTTFHIYLPARQELSGDEQAPQPGRGPKRCRILVMDDDESVRRVVGLSLRRLGHEVELAEDGQMAIEMYELAKDQGCPFDAVILDLMVPKGIGGQEAIQTLRRIDPAVKAVVMSGYANDPVVLEHERHGFKGALAKPFDHEKLQETLSRVMAR